MRGLEALTTGFTPTPAQSVVKLGKSQRDFFSIARVLRAAGYDTSFIYGGEAQFDFTTTNHSPWEYPEGRIEPYDADPHTVNNAVKYADHALGDFMAKARASAYWDDTVFLVVADHNSRVLGAELVPVWRFHIPALILGGGIAPGVYSPVASQIDLPPTLLSLIGVSSEHPMIGHDLTRSEFADWPGRAIMQYEDRQAYMLGREIAILRKGLPPATFVYDGGETAGL